MPLLLKISIWTSFGFMLSELILSVVRRSGKRIDVKRRDKGSVIIIWVIITISLTAGFSLSRTGDWHLLNYILSVAGLIFIIIGLAVRWTAVVQLDKAFTVDVAVSRDQKLKTDGIYCFIRHPGYSGMLLFMLGETLVMNSVFSFLVVLLPVSTAIFYRIHVEEKLLEEKFGDEYREYRLKTRTLVPFIF